MAATMSRVFRFPHLCYNINRKLLLRNLSASVKPPNESRDPAPLFFNDQVQTLLKRLTGVDLDKVFRTVQIKLRNPEIKFMTTKQLEEVTEAAKARVDYKIQMTPVLKVREPIDEIISFDPKIQGRDTATYVFTDISLENTDRNRLIVVRETDGTLRKANWSERDRMNSVYFPKPWRKLDVPKMFDSAVLQEILDGGDKYEFVLDRTALQFEPDDPEFIKVTNEVYQHIDKHRQYDVLKSTRHYGPMIFCLTFNKTVDNIITYLLVNYRLNEAADVVRLYSLLHPDSAVCKSESTDDNQLLKLYVERDSTTRHTLELTLAACQEALRERTEYVDAVKQAHGHV